MAIFDVGPLLVEDVWIPGSADQRSPDGLSVLDTIELRWFVPGPIPSDIDAWFSGSTEVCEQRCDTYLLDGRDDVGIKRRSREMLEVKVRQSLDGWIQLGEGLAGQLEAWRKWSPVEGLVDDGSDRGGSTSASRSGNDGSRWTEPRSRFRRMRRSPGAGCDVEIAEVTVGAMQGWTLRSRRSAARDPTGRIARFVAGLTAATPCPESFGPRSSRAMGYPEWLARTLVPDLREKRAHRQLAGSR